MLQALSLLALGLAGAWAVWRFGAAHLDPAMARLLAGGISLAGAVLAVVVISLPREAPQQALFETLIERNQGTVSHAFFVADAGAPQELRVWPQHAGNIEVRGPLTVRVVLSAPGGRNLFNEVVDVLIIDLAAQGDAERTGGGAQWAAPAQAGKSRCFS